MENRPVDPGSIQGNHRPISFIRIKHRTRADDILCKTVDKSPKVYTQLAGFCGWVPEALCNPAQMRTQDGPAFRGSRPEILHKCGRRTVLHLGAPLLGTSRVWACCTCFTMLAHSFPYTARVGVCRTHVAISILVCHLRKRKVSLPGVYQELWTRITRETS